MFTVDGLEWNIPCQIDRTAEVRASEISGVLLDKTYFNDIMGTYMKYDISIAVPVGMEYDYANLYELLTDPVDAHSFTLPYNQSTVELTARVETISDRYYKSEDGTKVWRGIKFSVIANHPTKEISLDESIAHGLSPVPDVLEPEIGELYEYTASGWEQRSYDDADDVGY